MTNDKFQVGDKIKAGPFTADLGLTPGNIYTVHHVDDFGLVQPDGARHHCHSSHFEMVERAASAPETCYSLEDGKGDWHFSTESAEGPFLLVGGYGDTYHSYEEIADLWSVDDTPTPTATAFQVGDRVRIVSTSATEPSHGIADEMRGVGDEFTVTEVGTNEHGPYAKGDEVYWWHPDDLEPSDAQPAPLKAGDAVLVWVRVTDDHPGESGLTAVRLHNDQDDVYAYPRHIVRPAEGQMPPWHSPKPAEPTGRGAFAADAKGKEWARVDNDDHPWRLVGQVGGFARWDDLDIPADGVKWEGMQ